MNELRKTPVKRSTTTGSQQQGNPQERDIKPHPFLRTEKGEPQVQQERGKTASQCGDHAGDKNQKDKNGPKHVSGFRVDVVGSQPSLVGASVVSTPLGGSWVLLGEPARQRFGRQTHGQFARYHWRWLVSATRCKIMLNGSDDPLASSRRAMAVKSLPWRRLKAPVEAMKKCAAAAGMFRL